MEAYADEYPDRVSRTPILISQANSYSYANFERMVSKTGSDDKMTMGQMSGRNNNGLFPL